MADASLKRQLRVLTVPVFIEMALIMLLGLAVSALLFFFAETVLQLMGLRPELMGDGLVYLRIIGIIFQWSIAVGLSYVIGIPLGYGLVGMWIGFALDENIRGVILLRRWHSGKWKTKGFTNARRE